jgi:hypothetical protein
LSDEPKNEMEVVNCRPLIEALTTSALLDLANDFGRREKHAPVR